MTQDVICVAVVHYALIAGHQMAR